MATTEAATATAKRAAASLIGEFAGDAPTLAILKHTNPCGVGQGDGLRDAWEKAFATDRQAPFGGIIVVNQTLGQDLAEQIKEIFTEVIIAPRFSDEALAIFAKKKNLRLMIAKEGIGADALQEVRSVVGGVLVQDRDRSMEKPAAWKVVTKRQPTKDELDAMLFGWKVANASLGSALARIAILAMTTITFHTQRLNLYNNNSALLVANAAAMLCVWRAVTSNRSRSVSLVQGKTSLPSPFTFIVSIYTELTPMSAR